MLNYEAPAQKTKPNGILKVLWEEFVSSYKNSRIKGYPAKRGIERIEMGYNAGRWHTLFIAEYAREWLQGLGKRMFDLCLAEC